MSLSNISANEIDAFGEILATFVTICCYLMIILGLISHSLSIVVFTRRSLRSNPYSCYFLAATLNGVYVVTMNMLLWPLQVILRVAYRAIPLTALTVGLTYVHVLIFFQLNIQQQSCLPMQGILSTVFWRVASCCIPLTSTNIRAFIWIVYS
ncbi:unnamed protein product [Rotaria socialis]|uniref:Uncharacterized protein n=1 Tax=Rotaria socialis TaxID=392032 RepID=A0A821DSR3_9BILA|nr:unnamed protein product [Rotaria socialis]